MTDLSGLATTFLKLFDAQQPGDRPASLTALTIDQAYTIQQLVIDARTERGERVVGYKVGCTSSAIRRQFGLEEPICGRVLQPHVYQHNARLDCNRLFQPAVEPEFVIRMGADLDRELVDDEPIEQAIESVAPGIEIHNYHFWFGQPTLQELIASNGIHASLVVGEPRPVVPGFDWNQEQVSLIKNDALAASGSGAEIMGGPLISLRWLANHLLRRGQKLRAGDMVIPGSPVELIPVRADDVVTAQFSQLGQVTAAFINAES